MSKYKIEQFHFSSVDMHSMYIEKRPQGKWLVYKNGVYIVSEMKLTKKSFKHLKRFTNGIVTERFMTCEEYDQDDDLCDIPYSQKFGHGGRRINNNLPIVVRTPKTPAPFVMQRFVWKNINLEIS
jgi:hypothetical protein